MRRKIIKVFLGSPGDLVEERKAAKRIVDEENRNHAVPQGYQFELVGWEDTVAQHGRAQAVINRDLDQCSYFVGVLWKRWGTPPGPEGGPYTSGFEEEYQRSAARYENTGKPDISLLFRTVSSDESSDAGPQLKKVLDFKRSFVEGHRGVYQTFDDLREFEDRFRSILALFLRKEFAEEVKVESEEQSRTLEEEREPEKGQADLGDGLFEKEIRNFVSDLISRPSDPKEYEYSAAEVARLRLLGSSLKRSGNDEAVVGVHDANILYKELRNQEISDRECRSLVRAGLTYFNSQNAPLWSWLWKLSRSPLEEAAFRTLIGSDEQKKSAFQILGLLSDDLFDLEKPFSRDQLLKWWLSNEESDIVVAALSYLGQRGVSTDLSHIDTLLDSSEVTISKAAVSAKIGILLREGVEPALEFISMREDADPSDALTDLIFVNPTAIRTDLLQKCLSNRSTKLKRSVAQALFDRKELRKEDCEVLVQSTDAQTRLLGALYISASSADYSLTDARNHLVRPRKENALSLLATGYRDFEGEDAFEKYKHVVLCSREQEELKQLLKSEDLYSYDITFALYDKYFSKYRVELVKNLDDGFIQFLEKKSDQSDPATLPDKKVRSFICQKMTQNAVSLLSEKGRREDIKAVRAAIDRGGVEYTEHIVRYLEKNGNWEDVSRVVRLCENIPTHGMSLISVVDRESEYRFSAKAMLKLGKKRVADMLTMSMPSGLWNAVVALMGKSLFMAFDDDRITAWLRDEIESKRKTVALKCVTFLPKARLSDLLSAYIAEGNLYYYNVVLWLDLGVSADRTRSAQIARNALKDA